MMRSAAVCLLVLASLSRLAARADESPAPARDHEIRIEGWNVQLVPQQSEPEPPRIAPKPDPQTIPEPIPAPVPALPHLKAPPCLETFVHRLRHVSAMEAAESLNRSLHQRHSLSATPQGLVVESKVVIVPDAASNSLIVVSAPEFVTEIHGLISRLDAPPKQFAVQARVTQVGPDGSRRRVSEPKVVTIEGRPVAVMCTGAEGQGFELELIVEEFRPEAVAVRPVGGQEPPAPATVEADVRNWVEITVPPRKGSREDERPRNAERQSAAPAEPAPQQQGTSGSHNGPRETTEVRVYALMDFVARSGGDGRPILERIAATIEQIVEPKSWESAGGEGAIRLLVDLNCLVVRQSRTAHEQIAELLESLRSDDADARSREAARSEAAAREAEARIERRLSEPITLRVEELPLRVAMQRLAAAAGINVVLDQKGLAEEGVDSGRRIWFETRGATLRDALEQLLGPLHLSWRVEDEVLQVTSRARALGDLYTQTYSVADLVAGGPSGRPEAAMDDLIGAVERCVQPTSWTASGGPATMRRFDGSLTLVVRQTESGHRDVEDLLSLIRSARQAIEETLPPARLERRFWIPVLPLSPVGQAAVRLHPAPVLHMAAPLRTSNPLLALIADNVLSVAAHGR